MLSQLAFSILYFFSVLFIGLGGFIGANLRYLIGVYINRYSHEMTGTLIVNITGHHYMSFEVL